MNFLHSSVWRNFQESIGNQTFDLGEGFCVKLQGSFGKNYLYSSLPEACRHTERIKEMGQRENSVFFKLEPMVTDYELQPLDYGFRRAVKALQPQKTAVLDLKRTEEEILQEMHKKHRYNIRLAEKKEVYVKEVERKGNYLDGFWNILQATAKQGNFHTHRKEYYEQLLNADFTRLFFAYKKPQMPVAAAVTVVYDDTVTYLHGASDYRYRRDMAPHLLHWHIMKYAKEKGYKKYDMWGINEEKWPGVTRFKKGFGAEEVEYAGSYDLVLQPFWYNLYKIKNFVK